jgi:uncharacterized FlaG/YvyC family protein
MDISGVNGNVPVGFPFAAAIPVDRAAENRDVVQAVKAINATGMFGEDNQLTFQRDPHSQRMVIRVVNQRTKEVVAQIPSEHVLRLFEDLKQ